jgi:hypothetical protein
MSDKCHSKTVTVAKELPIIGDVNSKKDSYAVSPLSHIDRLLPIQLHIYPVTWLEVSVYNAVHMQILH